MTFAVTCLHISHGVYIRDVIKLILKKRRVEIHVCSSGDYAENVIL